MQIQCETNLRKEKHSFSNNILQSRMLSVKKYEDITLRAYMLKKNKIANDLKEILSRHFGGNIVRVILYGSRAQKQL